REAARRSTCTNNLKQIGVALQNYTDVYGRFPINGVMTSENGWTNMGSEHVRLLPFLEQQQIYNQLNFQLGLANASVENTANGQGQQLRKMPIPALICPSDTSGKFTAWGTNGATNYGASIGPN
ncbi:MAG TPA: DUF1559 domain-containing protein, partial [Pirellulales bacterium]|nr:DUF1559 domain-containing protein [Pirellulales bacterium]